MPPRPAVSNDSSQASETSVRQLIANGKFKIALDNAKQFHKAQGTAASERLLLDAYTARIQSLLDQNLATEANSLLELVRDRFPSARERFDALKMAASARSGEIAGLLQPLNDPDLNTERRAAIEQIIQTQVTDLAALADCAALPPEHSLRLAAAALGQAFHAVTSGPVTEEQIALPEVSRRSPLAPWKLLIRAIACLQRGGDEECREYLAAIQPETVPARLVPAMRALLDAKTAAALKPAEAALISRTAVSLLELRNALANLDRAFAEAAEEGPIFKAVRAAVRECRRSAPDQLDKLKQLITVRGGVAGLDDERLLTALEGAARRDAAFFRMYARAMENSDDPEDLGDACKLWDDFRQQAVRENWFHDNGVEVATLYLHMADVLGQMPGELLKEFRRSGGWGRKPAPGEDRYFLFPENSMPGPAFSTRNPRPSRNGCAGLPDNRYPTLKVWPKSGTEFAGTTSNRFSISCNRPSGATPFGTPFLTSKKPSVSMPFIPWYGRPGCGCWRRGPCAICSRRSRIWRRKNSPRWRLLSSRNKGTGQLF